MSTGPIAVMYSRRTRVCPSPSSSICSASRRCRSASTPSFCRPGIDAELVGRVVQDLVDRDHQQVGGLRVGDPPELDDPGFGALLVDLLDRERAGRAHPVERLVAQRVGVHEHAAVALEHEQAGRERQVRAQASGVVDRAAGNDETHPSSLGADGRATRRRRARTSRGRSDAGRSRRRLGRAAGAASTAQMMRPSTISRALSTPIVLADESDQRRADEERGVADGRDGAHAGGGARRVVGCRRHRDREAERGPEPPEHDPDDGDRDDRHEDDDREADAAAAAP